MSEILVPGERHYIPDQTLTDLRFRFFVEDDSGKLSLQTTSDGGKTWRSICSEVPSNASAGWVLSLAEGNTVKWTPLSQVIRTLPSSIVSSLQTWTDFSFPADLQDDVTFGMFEVPSGKNLQFEAYGVQVSVFNPTQASNLEISFLNFNTSDVVAGPYRIDQGIGYKSILFDEDDVFVLGSGSKTVAKITLDDSVENPGSFLVARLLLTGI
jgi:hypothetical protein